MKRKPTRLPKPRLAASAKRLSSPSDPVAGSGPAVGLPAKVSRRVQAKGMLETLQSFMVEEPELPAVRALLDELERILDSHKLTQLELRNLCQEKIGSTKRAGVALNPLTRELAILGAYMAALIIALRGTLAKATKYDADVEHDEYAKRIFLMSELLSDCDRCFRSLEGTVGLGFGREHLGELTSALLERFHGRNHPLLVTGHLADQLPTQKFTWMDHLGIKTYAAALVEAMVVAEGPGKGNRTQSCESGRGSAYKGRV